MTGEVLLEAVGVSKSFPGVQALDRVNFTLRSGSIHALCGENGAGKSTLMNILIGYYRKDKGVIRFRGRPLELNSPRQALHLGISIIEQELNIVPEMTVAENMFLGREPGRNPAFVDYRSLHRAATEYLERVGIEIDPRTKMRKLSLAQVQLVEIAKALSRGSAVIFMDERPRRSEKRRSIRLFDVLRGLKQVGTGIVYVTHKLDEIFAIADHVTVLRDGKFMGTESVINIDRPRLINLWLEGHWKRTSSEAMQLGTVRCSLSGTSPRTRSFPTFRLTSDAVKYSASTASWVPDAASF